MGEGSLNIKVEGDENACRQVGTWLKGALSQGTHGLAEAFGGTAGQSESFWSGDAANAFRSHMNNAKTNADRVAETAGKAGAVLSAFADDLGTVKSRMRQAAAVASSAGLAVSDTEIQPPGPAPAPSPAGPQQDQSGRDQDPAAHDVALAAHDKQVRAWAEVHQTVADARGLEVAAHSKLDAALNSGSSELGALKTVVEKSLSTVAGTIGGFSKASHDLMKKASQAEFYADLTREISESPELTSAQRASIRNDANALYNEAIKHHFDKASIDRIVDKIPGWAQTGFKTNLSDLTGKLTGFEKNVPEFLRKDVPVLKKLPVVGTALTAGFAVNDIAQGKDALKTTENAVGGTVAGWAGAAAASAMIPGPGWAVAGGIVIGGALATGVGYVVDNYGDQINHWVGDRASDVGHGLADAGKAVGKFVGDLF